MNEGYGRVGACFTEVSCNITLLDIINGQNE